MLKLRHDQYNPSIPSRERWLPLAAGALVFLVLLLVDELSLLGTTPVQRIWDDLAGAIVVGVLVFVDERRRRRYLERNLETIALMNHHVRNALQAIKYAHYSQRELAVIEEAVARIEWALREILPGKSMEAAAKKSEAKPPKSAEEEKAS